MTRLSESNGLRYNLEESTDARPRLTVQESVDISKATAEMPHKTKTTLAYPI
jgi:hypothetical protein